MRKLLSLLALSLLSGCANLSSLQTARVMPKNEARGILGFGYFQSPTLDAQINDSTGTSGVNVKFPYLELAGRMGLGVNMDVGAKITLPGFLSGDIKYQFLDAGGFAAAAGAGLGYLGIAASSSSGSNTSFSATFLDALVPVYLSYDFADWIGIYTSPKYLARFAFGTASGTISYGGSSFGVRIGDKGGVFLEGTYLKAFKGDFSQWQFTFAIFFGSASSVPGREKPLELDEEVIEETPAPPRPKTRKRS